MKNSRSRQWNVWNFDDIDNFLFNNDIWYENQFVNDVRIALVCILSPEISLSFILFQ